MNATAQTSYIKTSIGDIAIHIHPNTTSNPPIIFLHGVYFDHHLWDTQIANINDRTVISIDMPLHGKSRENIKADWTLKDCAKMLIEILDSLQIEKVIAIGHSWGSMTILRAAHTHPERFFSVGLCNMPYNAASRKQKAIFGIQHSMLFFRDFYAKQVAKALFGTNSLKENPSLLTQLMRPMSILSNKEVKKIDKEVILYADDTTNLIITLPIKAIALKGKEDYIPTSPVIENIVIGGRHVSPLEKPQEVSDLIKKLMYYSDKKSSC